MLMGFITHIFWLPLGALVGGSVKRKKCCIFERLEIAIIASGLVLAQGVHVL